MKKLMRLTDLSFLFVAAALVLAGCVKKDEFYDKNTDEPNRKQQVKIRAKRSGRIWEAGLNYL